MSKPDLSSVYGSGRGVISSLKSGPLTHLDSQLGALYLSQLNGGAADARGFGSTSAMTSAKDFAAGAQQFTQALVTGSDGAQYVVIDFTAKDGDGAALLHQLDALGIQHGSSYGAVASGLLRVDQIGALQGVSDLAFARESFSVAHAGTVTTQADHAEHADIARAGFDVDGTGIKVGVLSDSFDTSGDLGPDGQPDTAAVDIANGDLPTDTTVLQDYANGTDEGRAMAQLVHDLAPGSSIEFASANYGQAGFANNIINLALDGAQVIVDDVYYYAEPAYQNGIIAQAVNAVHDFGVTYFSSAGNQGFGGFEAQWHDSGFTYEGEALMDFGPGQSYLDVTATGGFDIISLFWDQPAASAGGPGSQSDVDLFLVDGDGNLVAYSAADNIDGDPFEILGFTGNPGETYYLLVGLYSGATPGEIKLIDYSGTGTLGTTEYNFNSGTLLGHAAADGAIAVGAADYRGTPAYGTSPPELEYFSSGGPTYFWYADDGTRYDTVHVAAGPEITAVDGGNTSFFYPGDNPDQDIYPNFFGTSAAAPDAAAVAALLLQANPGLTPDDIKALLQDSAIDMDNPDTAGADPGIDSGSGAGLIQADKAVFFAKALSISNEGSVQLFGTHFGDAITGNALDNFLDGGAGNDTLDGGAGGDSLVGGNGDDLYLVDNANDTITETSTGGYDTVKASAGYTLSANIEKLILVGQNIAGTGNAQANEIDGGTGNDTLDGGGGADTLKGGAGDDVYHVDNTGVTVFEAAGAGFDTVQTSLSTYTLGTNLEALVYTGAGAFTGTGNTLANSLLGGAGNDSLFGGAGADTLTGGGGHDVLNGGALGDTFVFSGPDASSSDEVVDFSKLQGDHVGLSAAGFGVASIADVDFVSGATATPFEGKATLIYTAGDLYWDADGNGAGARVLLAHFDGTPALAATDFLLV